jgi:sirohydrochlorin ferrochelatase
VSWKHSQRVPAEQLRGTPAHTLAPWVREQAASGEREFLFVPYFVNPDGAIGAALRRDLAALQLETGGFEFGFTDGMGESALARIVADHARATARQTGLGAPAVVVVDHGGPAASSAALRDRIVAAVRPLLPSAALVTAASMESPEGPEFAFNRPLFAEVLAGADGSVIVAPLFLSPGRHAGPEGDLAQIAARAAGPGVRCHFTPLIGTHPLANATLAEALVRALAVPAHHDHTC